MINNVSLSEQIHYFVKDKACEGSRLWMSARILKSIPLLPFSLLETLFNGLSYLFAALFCSAHTDFWKERTVSSFTILSFDSSELDFKHPQRRRYLELKQIGYSDLEIFVQFVKTFPLTTIPKNMDLWDLRLGVIPHPRPPGVLGMEWCKKIENLIKKEPGRINEKGHNGSTLLHLAIEQRNQVVVKLLLDLGADILAQNQEGVTAWDYYLVHERQRLNGTILETFLEAMITKKKEYEAQNTFPQTEHTIALEGIYDLPVDIKYIFLSQLDPKDAENYARCDTTISQEMLNLAEIDGHQSARKSLLHLGVHCFLGDSAHKIEYCEVPWIAREILKLCPNAKEIIFTETPKNLHLEYLQEDFSAKFPNIQASPQFVH
jgi:hypothetical protein